MPNVLLLVLVGVASFIAVASSVRLRKARVRLAELQKYEVVRDAEARAQEILKAAELAAVARRDEGKLEGQREISDARVAAKEIRASATDGLAKILAEAERRRMDATSTLEESRREAERILRDAKTRADETAGEALKALENVKELRSTAQALKNVVDGYGDQYIVPTFTLLDGLAEAFGFTEAGQKLKETRERVRSMVRMSTAAQCDYVEANRKATAIDFVLDAFNGKADSILAEVKNDNAGTLERRLRDAFQLVNHNGKAFRDARITSEYLAVRLEELRWACAVVELKRRDREEQRALKERLRDEERAQREFERSMKEAAKEEELIRKAMAKVQVEVDRATDEQRAKYEAQLRQLTEKLKEAEEKNQRALSMAQQTKAGHVYVISNIGSFGEHVYKIGLTRRLEPLDRIHELGDASVPFEFDVHAMMRSDDAPALERELHKRFIGNQVNKVNPRKEFFRVDLGAIRAQVDQLGLQVQWTLAAECREFRESQALDRAMLVATPAQKAKILEGIEESVAADARRVEEEIAA